MYREDDIIFRMDRVMSLYPLALEIVTVLQLEKV